MTRLLADPGRVTVTVAGGVPTVVALPGSRTHEVACIFARWRVSTGWWRTAVDRDYWKLGLGSHEAAAHEGDVAGAEIACELYRDRATGDWWLSRLYE